MKYLELDKEEEKIERDFEKGAFKSVSNLASEKKRYQLYAKNAMDKTKNVNLRVSEGDLLKIKSLAVEKGIPYQTLLSSLIHQYSSGRIQAEVL